MARFFTSDLHLFDSFVAEQRGFGPRQDPATAQAAAAAIANEWRATVAPEDEVYLLGDCTVEERRSREPGLALLASLPGSKHLIMGNHDSVFPGKEGAHQHWPAYLTVFTTMNLQASLTFRQGGREARVMLSHFPYSGRGTEAPGKEHSYDQWRPRDEGAWLLHGHVHRGEKLLGSRQLHLGWDAWGRLVPEAEVISLLEAEGAFGDLRHRAFLDALKRNFQASPSLPA